LYSVLQLLVTANVFPSSLILVTLAMEAVRSSDMSVLTRATRRHIPEDEILHGQVKVKSISVDTNQPPSVMQLPT
jgi:hypothetical protein